MENKGLCQTCVSDKTCSFHRKFPVIMCEEFNITAQETEKRVEKKKSRK